MVDCTAGIVSTALNPFLPISEATVSPRRPGATLRLLRFFGVTASFYMKFQNNKKKLLNDKRYLELQEQFNLLN